MNRILITKTSFAAALAALCAVAHSGALEPGYWHFWKTERAAPSGNPTDSFCVSATDAADPVVLIGAVPNDSSCTVKATSASGERTVNFDLSCNDGRAQYKATSVIGNGRFVTATVLIGQTYQKSYVHGVRADGCPK
jgi:hypothetical protein